jgi:hypothetical protein
MLSTIPLAVSSFALTLLLVPLLRDVARRRLDDASHGNEIYSRCGEGGDGFQRDSSGSLGLSTPPGQGRGLPQFVEAHIVEQHHVSAGFQRFAHLRERIALYFDLESGSRLAQGLLRQFGFTHCFGDAAADGDVIVFDLYRAEESHAVVLCAATTGRVLGKLAHTGNGL